MGLDITISERKEYRCPNCGIPIGHTDIASTDSSGRVWYDFLEKIGYYAVMKEVYNWDGVESVVAEALAHGNKVVTNADW